MKGVVEKLYDIDSIEIPEELLDTNVDEKRVEEAVQQLSLRYGTEKTVDTVSTGDLVYCKADVESYPDGRTIYLYTGMNLPGAAQAEDAVLGKHVGEAVHCALADKQTELTIEKIVRRIPAKITDKLIAGMGIEGVNTVAAYRNHIREKMREDLMLENSKEIGRFFIDKMVEESTYAYDEGEMEAYIQKEMDRCAEECEEEGMDASEEEIREGIISQTKQGWMTEAFCKSKGIKIDADEVKADTDQMIEMMELMGEEVPDPKELQEMAFQDACFNELMKYIDKIVEQKMGGSYGNC